MEEDSNMLHVIETLSCASPVTIFVLIEKLVSLFATMPDPRPSPAAVTRLPSMTVTWNGLPIFSKSHIRLIAQLE